MGNVLQLENISKNYGPLTVLAGIDLALSAGQSVAIIGPSGSGKSTLLHIAGLMDVPSRGRVLINGEETSTLDEASRAQLRLNRIGFVFQFHYLLADFDVLENVLIPCRLAGDDLMKATREANELLDRLGLAARRGHRPQQLSGGEQQRVAFARALIRHPDILLCDEPTGNLDQRTASEMTHLLLEEVKRRHVATIVVTHNEALAKQTDTLYTLTQEAPV